MQCSVLRRSERERERRAGVCTHCSLSDRSLFRLQSETAEEGKRHTHTHTYTRTSIPLHLYPFTHTHTRTYTHIAKIEKKRKRTRLLLAIRGWLTPAYPFHLQERETDRRREIERERERGSDPTSQTTAMKRSTLNLRSQPLTSTSLSHCRLATSPAMPTAPAPKSSAPTMAALPSTPPRSVRRVCVCARCVCVCPVSFVGSLQPHPEQRTQKRRPTRSFWESFKTQHA